jgi:serine/threonine-protein kinase
MDSPEARLRQRYERRIGTTIKKYQLDGLLGIGGTAAVFRATHRNGHAVALKVLHAEHALDRDTSARFLREGYVANKVSHPGAVRVLDDDVAEDGSVFLVMELLEGESLESRWQRLGERLPTEEVVAVGHEVLGILAAAHESAIVHRDVKPENVFVTCDGAIKILDFGIARLRDGPSRRSATLTGRAFGTPAFMPPEQALGKSGQIDGRTDLWAVAAMMFTLLSGRHVHEADTVEELLVFAATRPARPLASVARDVPLPLAGVIDRGLAFEQADRWQDARTMQAALESAHREAFAHSIPRLAAAGRADNPQPQALSFAPATEPMPRSRVLPAAQDMPGLRSVGGAEPSMATLATSTVKVAPSSTAGQGAGARRRARWLGAGAGAALVASALAVAWVHGTTSSLTGTGRAAAVATGPPSQFAEIAAEPSPVAPSASVSATATPGAVASPLASASALPPRAPGSRHATPLRGPSVASSRRDVTSTAAPSMPTDRPVSSPQEHDIFKP